jgi:hypothetical protein
MAWCDVHGPASMRVSRFLRIYLAFVVIGRGVGKPHLLRSIRAAGYDYLRRALHTPMLIISRGVGKPHLPRSVRAAGYEYLRRALHTPMLFCSTPRLCTPPKMVSNGKRATRLGVASLQTTDSHNASVLP